MSWSRALCCVAVGSALVVGLSGCVGYGSYPPIEGSSGIDSPNAPNMAEVTVRSLERALADRRFDGRYAVSFPPGTWPRRARAVMERLEDPDGVIASSGNEGLPTVYISRIWVRGSRAEVDVMLPLGGLSGPEGGVTYQTVTYYLSGGLKPWGVDRRRSWAAGAFDAPARYDLSAEESEG